MCTADTSYDKRRKFLIGHEMINGVNMVKKCVDSIVRPPKMQIIGRKAIVTYSRAIKVNSTFNSWDKSQTLADTGYKFIDKRINRQVQNNNPIMPLVGYLSYKAAMRCKEVRKLNERGTTRTCSCCGHVIAEGLSPSVRTFTCPECGFNIPQDLNSTLNFLNIYQFAVWYSLRPLQCLSIARLLLNPSSDKKRTASSRTCVLNYQ